MAFAALFIAVSVASSGRSNNSGYFAGIYALAVIVGVSDIDFARASPSTATDRLTAAVIAIPLATSLNNVLKAVKVAAYSGGRRLIGLGRHCCCYTAAFAVAAAML